MIHLIRRFIKRSVEILKLPFELMTYKIRFKHMSVTLAQSNNRVFYPKFFMKTASAFA